MKHIFKKWLVSFLRRIHLLETADFFNFLASTVKNSKDNKTFRRENPVIPLPPPYMLFESFGKFSYKAYYENGKKSAEFIIGLLKKHKDLNNAKICEWGCGPARILRHFPELLRDCNIELYGTDYNPKTIDWCRKNLEGINFSLNNLHPPLEFRDNYFDSLYCISVFTHLSPALQKEWLKECMRVLKPGGIFLMTVHGDSCASGLLPDQKKKYSQEGILILGNVKQGKRTYASYYNPDYMKNVLLKVIRIEEHIPGKGKDQDIWIIRK